MFIDVIVNVFVDVIEKALQTHLLFDHPLHVKWLQYDNETLRNNTSGKYCN